MAKVKRPFVEFAVGESPVLEMFHVPDERTVTVRFLGNPVGCFIHRKGNENVPCAGAGECHSDPHRYPGVWKGYAPAERWRHDPYGDWVPIVLEITAMLGQKLGIKALRGQVWQLYRTKNRYGHKEGDGHQVDLLSPADCPMYFDPRPIVMRVYNTNLISFDEANPLPARQVVEASKGYVPPTAETPDKSEEVASAAEVRQLLRSAGVLPIDNKSQRQGKPQ